MATFDKSPISQVRKQPFTQLSRLGFVMPFQPSMWNDQTMQLAISNIIDLATIKLKQKYITAHVEQVLVRIQQLFKGLNYNTLYESLAVLLSAESEKVLYLNFPVKRFVSCSNDISILDLAGSVKKDPDFYIVFIENEKIVLYEYCNSLLKQLYEQHVIDTLEHLADVGKKISIVLRYMTNSYQKPVFIVGTQAQVNAIEWASPLPETIFRIIKPTEANGKDSIQMLTTVLSAQWRHWQSKFYLGSIERARKSNRLVFGAEKILTELCNNANGLLLVEKKLKKELIKRSHFYPHFQEQNSFIRQVEKFLSRGNQLRFIESGSLKLWNGMVLLPNQTLGYPGDLHAGSQRSSAAMGSLF